MMTTEQTWSAFLQHRPTAARLALLTCLPVRVTPALVRLARLRLLPLASTDTEADLWLSDLVEARSLGGFVYHRAVRELLRRQLRDQPDMLDAVWHQVYLAQAPWLLPRIRLEVELAWRLLRDPADSEIEARWCEVINDLKHAPNPEGLARWIVRAVAELPECSLACESGRRAFLGAHILLGDATVLGEQTQRFRDTDHFAFATRRLARTTVFVGLSERGVLVDPSQPIRNGHAVEIPATKPLWLQFEPIASTETPVVVALDGDRPVRRDIGRTPFRLRLLDGSAYELHPQDQSPSQTAQDTPPEFPRVELRYRAQAEDESSERTLAFDIWVFGDFMGATSGMVVGDHAIPVQADDIGTLMQRYRPSLVLDIGEIGFASTDDFSPAALIRNVPALRSLSKLHDQFVFLANGTARSEALKRHVAGMLQTNGLLVDYARYAGNPSLVGIRYQKHALLDALRTLAPTPDLEQDQRYFEAIVALADHVLSDPTSARSEDGYSLHAIVRDVKSSLEQLLKKIMGDVAFRQLQASWLGLAHLLDHTPADRKLNIRVASLTKKHLLDLLASDNTADPAHSRLFSMLQPRPGATARSFGCIIGDFYFNDTGPDLDLLDKMADLCAGACMPFIAATRYQQGLMRAPDRIRTLPEDNIHGAPAGNPTWEYLRTRPESRYIVLTTPRFMARRPTTFEFGRDSEFTDTADRPHKLHYVWANSAYLLAINIGRSFHRYGWFAKLGGAGADTLIGGLPFNDEQRGRHATRHGAAEVFLTSRDADNLAQRGFTAVIQQRDLGTVMLGETVPIWDIARIDGHTALASTLPYLLALCGFAHCIQGIVDSTMWSSPDTLNTAVNAWLADYVSAAIDLSEASRARFPLASAVFRIEKTGKKKARYEGTLLALPRFKLHELSRQISIKIMIPEGKIA